MVAGSPECEAQLSMSITQWNGEPNDMKNPTQKSSPQFIARLAGLCYLITILVGAFDHLFVGGKLIVPGDAGITATNIMRSAPLYRLAFTLDLVPVYAVATVLLYELLKPVNRSLSLLAAFSSLLGGAIGSAIAVFQFAPLVVLGGAPYLHVFSAEQLQALAMLSLKLHELGFTISLVFFGFYCFLLGWLIIPSTFLPRTVGILMVAAGLAYASYGFAYFASPWLAASWGPYALMFGSLGEAALTLWLLVFGVNASKWLQRAATA